MGLIERLFNRNSAESMPVSDDFQKKGSEDFNQRDEYIKNLQNFTKGKQNSFEGLTREQCYERILSRIGVSSKFIENPRAREMIFSEMTDLNYSHSQEDYLFAFSKNSILLDVDRFYARLISDIKDSWIISGNSITTKKTELIKVDGVLVKTQVHKYSFEQNEFIAEKTDRYVNANETDHSYCTDSTSIEKNTYDKNGVEMKRFESSDGVWYGRKTKKSFNIERDGIDTAKYSDDQGRSCVLDLIGEHYDIANLTAVNVYYDGGMPDNIYVKSDESERKNRIEEAIDKSKFSNGCKELYDNRDNGNVR